MTIGVVVPTYRRPDQVRRCLAGLFNQTRPPEAVFIVVRAGDTETLEVLSEGVRAGRVCTVISHETGQVDALNAGLAAIESDIIAITDDDTIPAPEWLDQIHRYFDQDPGIGGVGGRDIVHREDGSIVEAKSPMVGTVRWYGRIIGDHHTGIGGPREVWILKGANMAYRAKAIEGLKFEKRLRGAGAQVANDAAFALSVRKRGWKLVYDPSVAVDHYPATRYDADQRNQFSATTIKDNCHNTIVAFSGLPKWRAFMVILYEFLRGGRTAPGLVLLPILLVTSSNRVRVLISARVALEGRLAGLCTLVRTARRSLN